MAKRPANRREGFTVENGQVKREFEPFPGQAERHVERSTPAGYGDVRMDGLMVTQQSYVLNPTTQSQQQMARQGLRYGDPDMVRYATGRVDGAAPSLSTADDFTLRTKTAGHKRDVENPHPSARGLVQPKRRSVW